MAPIIRSEDRLTCGYRLSHPPPGEEIVVTGISGSFPDSDSVKHLEENLFNKVDLISDDDRRWKMVHPEIPQRTGKINNLEKFDAAFFNVHFKEAHSMDPIGRRILERVYEAVIDAGVNPKELRNTNTGVFVGSCLSESEKLWFYDKMQVNGYGVTGCSRAMVANRISHWLGVKGPSYTVDTACSSSLYAMDHAFRSIRNGHCEAAIVAGSNLCLHPLVSYQFFKLGVLSPDGRCKSFDNRANGYVRSEAIVACYLQKAKDSRRIYAQIVHAKTNCDGYKDQGIFYPAGHIQKVLLTEFYEECRVPPNSLHFVETHGTGTKVGDVEELTAIKEVFCDGRSEPLYIGSVKSNLGHSEGASGLCSIAKVCIAYQTGYIPPNLHYQSPREGIACLTDGTTKVVSEKQPWNRGLVGINSFGFGGANAHTLFKNFAKLKVNKGLPSDDLPRLVCVSGRTESAVARILDDLESRTVDVELVRLLHALHDDDITGHNFRGYALLGSKPTKSVTLARDTQYVHNDNRPVWFVYSDLGSQWPEMGTQLMRIPVFAAAIERCHKILDPKGVNLTKIITDPDPKIYDNILNSFVGIAAVQIGLTDVLKTVGIEPDFIIGRGVGEFGCAYADGSLTAEQMILCAYYQGLACITTSSTKGAMAVVNVGYNEIKTILPSEIDVAYHDRPDSCTISGPADKVKAFVNKLVEQGISAEEIQCANIAHHSRYIAEIGQKLLNHLTQVCPTPKPRSQRWLSTSIQQALWNEPTAQMSSAEYYTNNFLSPVLFEETIRLIPTNAITVEIGPHGLLQEILRRSVKRNVVNVCLTDRNHEDNVQTLFAALGKLYEAGLNPHLAKIYPTVQFPVSQETPMLAHLVEWQHSENWFVPSFKQQSIWEASDRTVNKSLADEDGDLLAGHVIDGRNLYPATGYIVMVWETLALMMGQLYTEVSVVFEDIRFQRATNIPKEGRLDFIVTIQRASGLFEIIEGGALVVSGRVYAENNVGQNYRVLPDEPQTTGPNVKYMLTRDFYKELKLRGYQYSGFFRGIVGCNVEGTRGRVTWAHNWIPFMDCMLQMKITCEDTRGLFVPTRIEKLSIDTEMHYEAVAKQKSNSNKDSLEVKIYPHVNVIRSGGVEIRGLHASAIPKKVPLGVPVLEKNVFIPNFGKTKMMIEDILRCNFQLIIDNVQIYKVKSVEIVDDQYKANGFESIMDKVADVLGDLPLIQSDLSVYTEDDLKTTSNVSVENKKISPDTNALVIIGANLLQRPEVLKQAVSSIRNNGFIISREKELVESRDFSNKYDIITVQNTGSEHIVLFRKRAGLTPDNYIKIDTSDDTYAWIDKVKNQLKFGRPFVVYSQGEDINGLLGLINCLRKEPGGEIVRGLLIADPSAPQFSPDLDFYKDQLEKDIAINVYQEGQWGTYRHLLLGDLETVKAHHAFVNTVTIGDLSTLRWLEGPIKENQVFKNPNNILIHVYCASLNFRDVMTAMGRVALDAVVRGRLAQECVQGFEVVGRIENGTRVMAMVENSGMANMVMGDRTLTWSIPDEWTFEEAATVPVAYGTVYYALIMVGKIQKGESILIHAGSGGVGQAAINVALHYGAEVFTTVGTPEKRAFIKKLFPQIKDSHIGNSRDTSFEQMVMSGTNGKGVDLVLNSLSDEKLQASIRCLGFRGRFLEIGKFDISNNTPVDLSYFSNETSFHGIMLDRIYTHSEEFKKAFRDLLLSGIESGAVRPLTNCTFEKDQVETAFRYMAAGKHIGKVLIKIKDEEKSSQAVKPNSTPIEAVPRYICYPDLVYIVVGGLGGFGLELADWFIMRGARKVLLTSRRGVTNGYQSSRLKIWASYGADVRISTEDITTEEGCEKMLKMANDMGTVEAIFNLAVVLKDCIFQNQTPETFKTSFAPKALATMNLDKLSTKLCPNLKNFVIFSSVSCGRGNAGQTNYGFSNSVMERICERRSRLGLPALAVQWGAIGDVGLVADMLDDDVQLEIGGTLQQRISSCLLCLDKFLKQDAVIVSSIVVAEKKAGNAGSHTLMGAVAQIMGIPDIKTVPQQVSLADLGMDSMMAVEIKQTLEREFEIFLTAQNIRSLTFAKLAGLSTQKEGDTSKPASEHSAKSEERAGIQFLIRNIGDEELADKPYIYPQTMISDGSENINDDERIMFMLPGLEGCAATLLPLCSKLNIKVCILQFGYEDWNECMDSLVFKLLKTIKPRLHPGRPFIITGYSFGCLVALRLVEILESEGNTGSLFFIDGSPDFIYENLVLRSYGDTDAQIQDALICQTIDLICPKNDVTKTFREKFKDLKSFDDRIQYAIKLSPIPDHYSPKFIEGMTKSIFDRLKMGMTRTEMKIESPIVLIRPFENLSFLKLKENYGLDKYAKGPVTVHQIEGDHMSIVVNVECANIINNLLAGQSDKKIAHSIVKNLIEKPASSTSLI